MERVAGTKYAKQLVELAELEDKSDDFVAAFWDSLNRGSQPEKPKKLSRSRMSEDAANAFERELIGFGRHSTKTYREAPIEYLVLLHERNERLGRYLRSDKGQLRQ